MFVSLLHNELPPSEVYGVQKSQGLTRRALGVPKTHPSSSRGSPCSRGVFKHRLITNNTFVSDTLLTTLNTCVCERSRVRVFN